MLQKRCTKQKISSSQNINKYILNNSRNDSIEGKI